MNRGGMHVVLFGIERYAGLAPVPGAAQHAIRYARWAVDAGVDPSAIVVFLSMMGAGDDEAASELAELGVPAANVRPARYAQIDAYLREELPHRPEPELLWMWSGHGYVIPHMAKRFVFPAETTEADMRGFSLVDLQAYLRSTRVERLDRQLLVFDVCAESAVMRLHELPLPTYDEFKSAFRGDQSAQQALAAARDGAVTKAGALAESVLAELETGGDAWPPADLVERLKRNGTDVGKVMYVDDRSEPESATVAVDRTVAELGTELEARNVVAFVGGNFRRPELLDEGDIAESIADRCGYPFIDHRRDLSVVLEFVARDKTDDDALRALADAVRTTADDAAAYLPVPAPAGGDDGDDAGRRMRLRQLARLPVDVYITTAYDDLLERALLRERRPPIVWTYGHSTTRDEPSLERPLVYHLYGRVTVGDDGIVDGVAATEDDLMRRNQEIARNGKKQRFPPAINRALRKRHLYAGFDLGDRVLRDLLRSLRLWGEVSGQLGFLIDPATPPVREQADEADARQFYTKLLTEIGPCKNVKIVWDFPSELFEHHRMEAS